MYVPPLDVDPESSCHGAEFSEFLRFGQSQTEEIKTQFLLQGQFTWV